jgi:L-lactate dehydrogenase complex protein LldF
MRDPDDLRDAARGVRHDIVADLPELLERFADRALDRGAHVCWASTAGEARDHVARVVADRGTARVLTAASPVTDEIDVDAMLAARGVGVVETDLGQWIARLADEVPNDVMAPARPERRQRMHDLFVERAQARPSRRRPDELVRFAQERRRAQLLEAEVGVAGADLAVADTGSLVLTAHEGDGRLLTVLPPVLVVVLGIDHLTASWDQADLLLAVQARSATGRHRPSQSMILTGPRRDGEGEGGGPEELHIVVLDNGRSRLLAQPEPTLGGVSMTWSGSARPAAPASPAGALVPQGLGGLGFGLANPTDLSGPVVGAVDGGAFIGLPLPEVLLALQQEAAHPTAAGLRGERGERAAWRLWATAWSDARRYSATTRTATWDRWVTRVAGRLPDAAAWVPDGEPPDVPPDRFRDRWWKGQV